MTELEKLATLIRERNAVCRRITTIIDRPAQIGHVGEYIASKIFDIQLEQSAVAKGIDGVFRSGPLARKTVNVKFYGLMESLLDIRQDAVPEYYLVVTGPRAKAMTSRGESRPWAIDYVFLFDGPRLVEHLRQRGVRICEATSVTREQWNRAEVYPTAANPELRLTDQQRELLKLFSSEGTTEAWPGA